MSTLDLAFAALGVIAAAAGLLAVTTTRVIHAALWLIVSLGALAGTFLVMGAEFVALVQILIYVGAIVVLVLFALMLTRSPVGPQREVSAGPRRRLLAAAVGSASTVLLLVVLVPVARVLPERTVTRTEVMAQDLFGIWVWPFELLSLLLLTALVAAFAVSRMSTDEETGELSAQPDPEREVAP
ncbi:MAG: NADH-quinone oxidoreductase subunit J [Intrasporangiaceae bacterium]|nr:NADH-quinone oxidoreductase subunit J [Intrasporangiaceae bacterium]